MKKRLLLLLIIAMTGLVSAESIALSPPSHELGEIQRGSSQQVTVYVDATGYDEPFRIDPSYQSPRISSIMREGSDIDRSRYSAQDISDWIQFEQETFRIDPNGTIKANGRTYDGTITYTVNVPVSDSEPGYHGGSITPEVIKDDEGSSFNSASSIGLAVYNFYFQVPGTAYRDVEYSPRVMRTGPEELTIVNRLVNQGTVSTTVGEASFSVENMNGNFSTSRTVKAVDVPEGGSETEVVTVNSPEVSAGNYRIEGTADFMTGQATASDSFSLSDIVEVEPEQLEGGQESPTGGFDNESLPLWLVVMILIVVGVLMYSFGIDPVWILAAVGVLGISMYIFLTPVPNLLLVVLLVLSGALVYYGAM